MDHDALITTLRWLHANLAAHDEKTRRKRYKKMILHVTEHLIEATDHKM